MRDTIKLLCITAQPKVTILYIVPLDCSCISNWTLRINSHCSSKISNCLVILMFVISYLLGKKTFFPIAISSCFLLSSSRYLLQPNTWSRCLQPLHIVEWNVTLLCILLGLASLEFLICLLQLGNGLINAIFRPCCYKQQYSLNA